MSETGTDPASGGQEDGASFCNGAFTGEGAEAKFGKSIGELYSHLGLPNPVSEDATLIGEGGVFESKEAAENTYNSLRRAQTALAASSKPKQPKGDGLAIGQNALEGDKPKGDVFAQAGVDASKLYDMFKSEDGIPSDVLDKIEKAGLPKQFVTEHLDMRRKHTQLSSDAFLTAAAASLDPELGEKLDAARKDVSALVEEAASFVPENEIDGLNEDLNDPDKYLRTIRYLRDLRSQRSGAGTGTPITGSRTAPSGAQPAKNLDELGKLTEALRRNPNDKALRARIKASSKLLTGL